METGTNAAVVLQGRHIRLEPLSSAHVPALCEAGSDSSLFRWYPVPMHSPGDMEAFVDGALMDAAAGKSIPFCVVDAAQGRAIGSTRFMSIDWHHRRGEIGATWYAKPWQRTGVNTEAKLLLLRHAFQQFGWQRVEFKTDSRNEQSRRALARIGAVEEGIFRYHMVSPDGSPRHSVYFAVTIDMWPVVEHRLVSLLTRN